MCTTEEAIMSHGKLLQSKDACSSDELLVQVRHKVARVEN